MKKIFSLFVILFMAIMLVACNRPSEEDPFKIDESTAVELSASEIIDLFSEIDQNQIYNDIFKIVVEGSFFQEELQRYNFGEEDEYSHSTLEGELEVELFFDMTEMVEDAFASFKISGQFFEDRKYDGAKDDEGIIVYDQTETTTVEGSLEAFLIDTYAYFNIDAKATSDYSYEDEPSIDEQKAKQKLMQALTQEMYEEVLRDQLSLISGMFGIGIDIDDFEDVDLDTIIEALPSIRAYKDGNKYTLVIEFTKQTLLDSFEDFIVEMAEIFGDGYVPEQSEIDDMIDQINEAIKDFEFKYLIVIEEGRILNMVIDIKGDFAYEQEIEYNWGYSEYRQLTVKFDFKIEISSVGTRPSIPTDLDEYEEVEIPTFLN
ncbi:MAG: hypothetical protein WC964_03300 [Acholeplasmataceae bacterium]